MALENLKTEFDEIFKMVIIPFFKHLGFKRKAQHFYRETNDVTQCFNVQRSQWNSHFDRLSFTFNLGFYNKSIREVSLGREVSIQFAKTTDCFIQDRLGKYSHKADHWYELNKGSDKDKVASQIKSDFENYLKPLFENYKSLNDLRLYAEKNTGFLLSPSNQIVFLMMTGQIKEGNIMIIEKYKDSLKPQTFTETINYPDGTKKERIKSVITQNSIENYKRLAEKYAVNLE